MIPKHSFFKKKWWAYLRPTFVHCSVGKSFSQGKNTSLSFPLALLFWQKMPLSLANNAEYLPCGFLLEDFIAICLRLRAILNPDDNNIGCLGRQADGHTNYPFL